MILTNNKTTEELIVETLHLKEETGPALLQKIQGKNKSLSKETFYRILRKLLKEEILTKQHKIYQLNRHWLQKIYRFSKKHIDTNQGIDPDNILTFQEGDKISYKFKNPNLMGIYWAHTYDMVFEQHDPKDPILIFHHHEWLIYARNESETFFLSRFKDDKKLVFFALGGNTSLDMKFKKDWENKFIQIGKKINYGLKDTEYINVLGDFIFKISVSKRFSDDIETFFQGNNQITDDNRKELEKICNRKDISKMVFIRSKKEANKWRSKFNKDFYKPKN